MRNHTAIEALHCGVVSLVAPLLVTKLYLPGARPDRVERPRLTERLAAGLQRPLALISAPAGFGKTSLLSDWRATPQGQSCSLAWLSLDHGDNDPARFWSYVLAALRTVPGLSGLPDELEAEAPPELLLAPLINRLAAAGGPVVLVLDDYHVIDAAGIHNAVGFLVEHMPAALRLVVLTRSDPPWPLARLRAHGLMSELRAADLRFTPEEAVQFFAGAPGVRLSDADIGAVEQRTEGWIAALQMVAISLEGHPDPHGFVDDIAGDNRYIADYLTEEVLARQPESLRRFLFQVSVLERMNGSLCDAVTGCADSRSRLEQIERKNLFLVPLDPTRDWFRFHHLFGELLRTRLHQEEPELVPELHRRASDWYARHDQVSEAVEHSLAAGDYDRVNELIESSAEGWWAMSHPLYRDLLLRLPPEVSSLHPWYCTYQAWLNGLNGRLEAASALIDAAERNQRLTGGIRSILALVRTYIADMSGQPCVITEQILNAPATIPEESAVMRDSADLIVAAILFTNGRLDEAASLLAQVTARAMARRYVGAVPSTVPRLALIRLIQGRIAEAAELCRRYLHVLSERGAFAGGDLHSVLADALRQQGDLEAAEAEAREGIRCNEVWAIPRGTALAMQALARVRLARGDADAALELLEREEAATRGCTLPPDLVSDRAALRVRVWLALGDRDAAARWARESGLTARDALSFRREAEHMALTSVLLATGRRAEATALIARLAEAAAAAGRLGRLAEIRSLAREEPSPLSEPLTEREREVLALLAKGCSNQELAAALFVTISTAKAHVHQILTKLDAPSRTAAVARARELGMVK